MIQKVNDIPEKKASRSEIVQALRDLKLGESLLISGQSLTDRTQSQVYRAASRLRLAIRTNKTSVGLRVWLKDSETASIKREIPGIRATIARTPERPDYYPPENGEPDRRTKEQKNYYLAEYFAGEVKAEPREAMEEIDEANAPETERTVVLEE